MNQDDVLNYLKSHGKCTVGEIAEGLGCDKTTNTVNIKLRRLVAWGRVRKDDSVYPPLWEAIR